jgi:Ferric uptake regulator family
MSKENPRNTKQLEVVWEAVKDDSSHPTADQVYNKVRQRLPNVSLGTVYRNLQKLVAEEKLQVLMLGRAQHFDTLVKRHQHLCAKSAARYTMFWSTRRTRSSRLGFLTGDSKSRPIKAPSTAPANIARGRKKLFHCAVKVSFTSVN